MLNHSSPADRIANTHARARVLKAFARQVAATHAAPGNATDMIILYACEACEACGEKIQAANATHATATLFQAGLAGLVVNEPLPPEGGWSDDFGGVTCGCC